MRIYGTLIHGNYLSQKDIEICLKFDVETHADHPRIEGIRELQAALSDSYKVEDAHSVAA